MNHPTVSMHSLPLAGYTGGCKNITTKMVREVHVYDFDRK